MKMHQPFKHFIIGSIYLKKGEKYLKDEGRSGRPITATTDDNISKIRAFIKSDPYCTYDEIEA
jgi:hypothetical protein